MRGAFEQVMTDANYKSEDDLVNKVEWTPSFLGHENVFNDLILLPYWPLCNLDRKYWHLSDNAFNGKYPLAPRLDLKMRQL